MGVRDSSGLWCMFYIFEFWIPIGVQKSWRMLQDTGMNFEIAMEVLSYQNFFVLRFQLKLLVF